jgi:hypothetical protein
MAAQRAARRFVMVMPAGNAAHIEARVAFGLGKPCYAVGPLAKTETPYRSSIGCLPVRITPRHGLPRRSVTPGNGRPWCPVKPEAVRVSPARAAWW